ncbi:MAG: DUF4367 domain-containing protein [Chloroflexi bacterium]|nr:MAG: DUF4367 domain-containing protein [Chloroflexota bacterium]
MKELWNRHISEGDLRAYADHELSEIQVKPLEAHLKTCPDCQHTLAAVSTRSSVVQGKFQTLPVSTPELTPTWAARARLENMIERKESTTVFNKIFSKRNRTAWAILGIVAIALSLLAFPGVRAIASSFLGLFRVEEVAIVQVNPGDLPQQLGSSAQLEMMFTEDVQVEEEGEAFEPASIEEAESAAGFDIRLPGEVDGEPELLVKPGTTVTFQVDVERLRGILREIGREDIEIPEGLDGEEVVFSASTAVAAQYGDCEFDPGAAREEGYDPDDVNTPYLPRCTSLIQMPSPTVEAKPGLDINKIGEAFLQVVGMTPEEAAQFSQSIDWTTTLVLPLPANEATYTKVEVDGVDATLITEPKGQRNSQYMLIWVKDGILYGLAGPGGMETALTIGNSLQ